MGLSRLDNFLKSVRGTILYVDPSSLDATDSIENQGNSLTRPFKTIQRALVESARFSYQQGLDNDRFGKTTILLYPGEHLVDNRPGWIPDGSLNFRLRSGLVSSDFLEWDLSTNFDLTTENNALYKLNSIHGGVIVPRGTSIVGMDLRKTKIRPKYVPDPLNDDIERSAVFRVTGACYLWQFTVLDSDPNGICYKDYTSNTFVPNFSHHKLSAFEYADGANNVKIDDIFQTFETARTDLDMYYEKVGLCYGQSSARPITPDYPSSGVDIQPSIDEYRIVGSRGAEVGISSIRAGDGVTPTTTITVTTTTSLAGLGVDTPIQINGVAAPGYDGQFVISAVNSDTEIQYRVQNAPSNPLPGVTGATLNISVDTVTSASPYIFNISLRSVYGMCGLLADGDKAEGFKSMVVAQFTGIGLQKDDNAFVKYDSVTGTYLDSTAVDNLHSDSSARFKPSYENFHIKAQNNAYLQLVSVFAIGYAEHFVVESGGDFSINNSNSNFGAKALVASGFRKEAFPRDDIGYITHIIPPKEIESDLITVDYLAIDVATTVGVATTGRLYLYNETNQDIPPVNIVDGYRLGAKEDEHLYALISQSGITSEFSARVVMQNEFSGQTQVSGQKLYTVGRSVGINSISNNILTLTSPHTFINGENVRIVADNGHLPDGIEPNQLYFAITNTVAPTLGTNQIKLAQTQNDAVNDNELTINAKGGVLSVLSRVSDKDAGEIGHPVQFDSGQGNWYVNVSTATTENTLYSEISSLGTVGLGDATSRTFIRRTSDTRGLIDTTYRLRYVIPNDSPTLARPPLDGYIIQESNNTIGTGTTEVEKYFSTTTATLSNSTQLRNFRFIANATWAGGTANIVTELPHDLTVGSEIEVINVLSSANPTGIANSAFNGTHAVTGISSTKQFSFSLSDDPGTFASDVNNRNGNLPRYSRKRFVGTYQVYRSQEVQKYIPNIQDGVYHLLVVNASNSPTISPFNELKFLQPIQNLYPQINRDNPESDPSEARSFAVSDPVGRVIINEPQNSITKETLTKNLYDLNVGIAITDISSSSQTSHTLYTSVDHSLSGITSVRIVDGGSGYVTGTYYNTRLVGYAGSTTGVNATAKVIVSAGGTVSSITIMDGGSAYGIGNTMQILGIGTLGSGARVSVTNVYNNIGDTVSVSGVTSTSYAGYNNLYKITGITTYNQIQVESSESVSEITSVGVGANLLLNGNAILSGKSLGISTYLHSGTTGISTIVFHEAHGFRVGNKLRVVGFDAARYNGDFIVKRLNSITSLTVNAGTSTNPPATGFNTVTVYRHAVASFGGDVDTVNESTSGRLITTYAGITTNLGADILATASDTTPLTIPNADIIGLKIGDYILIDDEILRIKSTVTSSSVSVFRAVLGTRRQTHVSGSQIRKVNVKPIELRRNSIIRASGHTFEYLGYGPGNYSTAFPERQNRILTPQEGLLANSQRTDGGITNYTGMDDQGNFYTGNKKLNSATGQEEVYDAPIPTVTGEDPGTGTVNVGFDVLSPLEISVNRSIRVEGGAENNLISEFDGPVVFNNRITSTSEKGLEVQSLFVQGDADVSRKLTVSAGSTPSLAGNAGDVVTRAFPDTGDYMGWIYTTQNQWEKFGYVGDLPNGISAGNANEIIYKDPSNLFAGNGNFLFKDNTTLIVGAASSTGTADQKLQVTGNAYISGNIGVGTITARTNLDVVGSEYVSDTVVVGAASLTGTANQRLQVTGGSYISGNTGIGTTNAQSQLHVSTGVSTSVDGGLARLLTPNLGIGSSTSVALGKSFGSSNFQSVLLSYNYLGDSACSGSYLSIAHVGQKDTLVVSDCQRVGINTVPRDALDVVGNARISGIVTAGSGSFIGSGIQVTSINNNQLAGHRNRIINGDMEIFQRNFNFFDQTSKSFAGTTNNTYVVDRWIMGMDQNGTANVSQSTDAPIGFLRSLQWQVGTADASLGTSQHAILVQRIEGPNIVDFAWGASAARPITVSFWVKGIAGSGGDVRGTYSVIAVNGPFNRSYAATYTINANNTWEYKTITIPGDIAGTWNTGERSMGLQLRWSLAAGTQSVLNSWTATNTLGGQGQVNLLATAGNTFRITGVQCELGEYATPFERRLYGTELQLCQRYYEGGNWYKSEVAASGQDGGGAVGTNEMYVPYKVLKYRVPTTVTATFLSGGQSGVAAHVYVGSFLDGFITQFRPTANLIDCAPYIYDWAADCEII
jgi:hypothetical protein